MQPSYGLNKDVGLVQIGNNVVMSQQWAGKVVQLNANGLIKQTVVNNSLA